MEKISLDFEDLIDIITAISWSKKMGWNFFTAEVENGLKIIAKHNQTGQKIDIENYEELSSFCISGRMKI
ncbi:hypothetical protein PP175_28520 (plasmid) [Aneurinibacillus sp. Ricciae_BoGa-3]|uniref:hypothetical protein n=1 Tax=Aneurinibacillus sp. Ricciae_BoGa-3 TaxID=3022697 RepID=UPI002341E6BD|nr:hypothetical protein [Aneurinibacillus sp. Ricciae_BoGa-3]WCK57136.1 hypothetical protein PP175_28520 [Aneurinibacillus sp. Ricciae_BoGa-3]